MKVSLAELEQAARSLDVKVTYEDLKTSKGGSCRVMASRRIIINKHLHLNEKINVLARELGRFDLAGLDLSDDRDRPAAMVDSAVQEVLCQDEEPARGLVRQQRPAFPVQRLLEHLAPRPVLQLDGAYNRSAEHDQLSRVLRRFSLEDRKGRLSFRLVQQIAGKGRGTPRKSAQHKREPLQDPACPRSLGPADRKE